MQQSSAPVCIFWFRRDLRLHDNHGLHHALQSGHPVLPIFIFDRNILDALSDRADRRVQFIHEQLSLIQTQLRSHGSELVSFYGNPEEAFAWLGSKYTIAQVICNEDYEPAAIQRDNAIEVFLRNLGTRFVRVKDQVVFAPSEVMKANGEPYTIFTPYSKVWKQQLAANHMQTFDTDPYMSRLLKLSQHERIDLPSIESMGFQKLDIQFPSSHVSDDSIRHYAETRNIPALDATSHLSIHLRFGTISVRELVSRAVAINEVWLNELIWREFFMMILAQYPHVVTRCFKAQYEAIQWRNNEEEFTAWCEGKTGYPLVDAGMRELEQTGFMHNRVRMVTASFLTKHLLIDWRWGEAYFARKLNDYELSSNNGNWQWSAGCGCDAAPYFRVFNPAEQSRKFDASQDYVRKWLRPEDFLRPPIVEHSFARNRALECYKRGLGRSLD